VVVGGAEQVAAEVGIPGEAIPFFLVAFQPEVRTTLPTGI